MNRNLEEKWNTLTDDEKNAFGAWCVNDRLEKIFTYINPKGKKVTYVYFNPLTDHSHAVELKNHLLKKYDKSNKEGFALRVAFAAGDLLLNDPAPYILEWAFLVLGQQWLEETKK